MALTVPSSIRLLLPGGVVKKLGLEEYVRGVVASALPADAPIEALKAQAVAARTFAANTRRHIERGADVCTLRHCQIYKESGTTGAETAASETRGIVAVHGGRLIEAYYFEHCDGSTRDAAGVLVQAPAYLRGVSCPCGFSTLKGHGIGMCQRGAQVMARFGDGFDVILKHYFTGISLERAGLLPAPLPGDKPPATTHREPPSIRMPIQPSLPASKPAPKSRKVVKTTRPVHARKSQETPPSDKGVETRPPPKTEMGLSRDKAAPAAHSRALDQPNLVPAPDKPSPPEAAQPAAPEVPAPAADRAILGPKASPAKAGKVTLPAIKSEPPAPGSAAKAPEAGVTSPLIMQPSAQVQLPPVQVTTTPTPERPGYPVELPPSAQPTPPPDHPEPLAQAAKSDRAARLAVEPSPAKLESLPGTAEEELWYPLPDESLVRADAFRAEVQEEELPELGEAPAAPVGFPEDLQAPQIHGFVVEELIEPPPAPATMPEEMPFFSVQVMPVEQQPIAPPPPLFEDESTEATAAAKPSPILVDRLPGPRMIAGDLAAPGIIVTIRDVEGHAIVTVSGTALHHGHGGFEAPVLSDGVYAVTFEEGALDVELRNETIFIQVAK